MYNGIGVQTARGTGTSGHVMKNLSSLRPIRKDQRKMQTDALNRAGSTDTDPGITLHKALRKIEVDLVKLRDDLEEEGLSEESIEGRIQEERELLRQRLEGGSGAESETRLRGDGSTHRASGGDKLSTEIEKHKGEEEMPRRRRRRLSSVSSTESIRSPWEGQATSSMTRLRS